VEIPGFKPVSQFKCSTVRAGGVAIYENEEAAPGLQSTEQELLKYDKEKMEVKRIATAHDGVGDICSVKTTINGQALLVSMYITPGTPMSKVEEFFELSLMAYSHKVVGLFKSMEKPQLSTIPIIWEET